MTPPNTITVTIECPKQLILEFDELCKKKYMSRSALIRQAMAECLNQPK